MKRLLLLSCATVLIGLLPLAEAQAQEAAKEEVSTIVKLKEKKSCCSDKKSTKECKEKNGKKEKVAEAKACTKKNGEEKSCCQKVAKKEEEVIPNN